jgi:hypothetical protein
MQFIRVTVIGGVIFLVLGTVLITPFLVTAL